MKRLTLDRLRARTTSHYQENGDEAFRFEMEIFLRALPNLPTDLATVKAWQIFLSCVERFGKVTITGDMEDYGREPGDIVWVNIDGFPGVLGPFPEAMAEAALAAMRERID